MENVSQKNQSAVTKPGLICMAWSSRLINDTINKTVHAKACKMSSKRSFISYCDTPPGAYRQRNERKVREDITFMLCHFIIWKLHVPVRLFCILQAIARFTS